MSPCVIVEDSLSRPWMPFDAPVSPWMRPGFFVYGPSYPASCREEGFDNDQLCSHPAESRKFS
jgi:hypothetical protein